MRSIFVSSTFRDMNTERDLLNRSIAPKINLSLAKYNQQIRLMDLRWGVDTSDLSEKEATERVLKVCFEEIEKCKPYILVMLGDRYGYIPDGADMSVTDMEILHGVLENTQPEHVLIYIRETDYAAMPEDQQSIYREQDPNAKVRLESLKEQLRQLFPNQCRTYRAYWSPEEKRLITDDFEDLVFRDLESKFVSELATIAYRSPLHRQLSENEEILADHIRYAYQSHERIAGHTQAIRTANDPVAIVGPAGAGKSVYMSLLCSAMRAAGHQVDILFCGDNAFSASVRNVAESVLAALITATGEHYNYEAFSELSYDELIRELSERRERVQKPCYIFLDAIDQCSDGIIAFILWCRSFLAGQVRLVCSSRKTSDLMDEQASFAVIELKYDGSDYLAMTNCLLSQYGKSLSPAITEMLCEQINTPLHLTVLVLRLINLRAKDFDAIQAAGGDMDAINTYLQNMIEDGQGDLQRNLFLYLSPLMNESCNGDLYIMLLGVLAYSEHGLTELDLREICRIGQLPWVQLDFVTFLSELAFFIRTRDSGRLDISHDILRQLLRSFFAKYRNGFCHLIAQSFLEKERLCGPEVRTFFSAVQAGGHKRLCVDFMVKHAPALASLEYSDMLLAKEIRRSVLQIFLADDGEFLLSTVFACDTFEEVTQYYTCLASSLFSVNDYIPKQTALHIAEVVMCIPLKAMTFPAEITRLEFRNCRHFLHKHLDQDDTDLREFLSETQKAVNICIENETSGQPSKPAAPCPVEEPLIDLYDPQIGDLTKIDIFAELAARGRMMAEDPESAEEAEALLLGLIKVQEETALIPEELHPMWLSQIYTSLGGVYKTMRRWEEAIRYDDMSLSIYRELYEKSPSPDVFHKYRERVYNVANLVEAWAMCQKNDQGLWEMTCARYADVYRLELQAIASGIPEREKLFSAGAILSYGTALIHTGRIDEGTAKYQEGIGIIRDLSEHHPVPDLQLEFCTQLLHCIYQLIECGVHNVAADLAIEIRNAITAVISTEHVGCIQQLLDVLGAFSSMVSASLGQMFRDQEVDIAIKLSRIQREISIAALDIAPHKIKANLLITQKNIADILYLEKKDIQAALTEYKQIFALIEQYDLTMPDENGVYMDEVNLRLADVYIRMILCFDILEQKEERSQMLHRAEEFASYLAAHSEQLKGDPAMVLYSIGTSLLKKQNPSGLLLLMKAFDITQTESYDCDAHSQTLLLILQALSAISGSHDAKAADSTDET